MSSPLDLLVDIVHSAASESWKKNNQAALSALFGTRYHSRAKDSVVLRAPDFKGGDAGVSYAAYIHPQNADSGSYGGMSFAIFPVEDGPCLVTMVIGTNGLAPDEAILGRPGHARKMQAVCAYLNHECGGGSQVSWAKQDPTRVDIDMPSDLQAEWQSYERVFKKYGRYLYAIYRPTADRMATTIALKAILDVMFRERGFSPLKEFQEDAARIESAWFDRMMPTTTRKDVVELLKTRRYVVIQGPPGTGKTRMARQICSEHYSGLGQTIQFHPNTTYETFVGGLAPVQDSSNNAGSPGFRFAPKPGFLMEAATKACENPDRDYLLHIDEINRADLGKILGEAIYLFEPKPEAPRAITLPYDFGAPFFKTLELPNNLHVLGTMNSADRSIAILDVAVRRRFSFVSLWPSLKAVEETKCALSIEAFRRLMTIFIEHAADEALPLVPGHSYFLDTNKIDARNHLRTSLAPLLTEYLDQGYVMGFAEAIRAYLQWLESL